MKGMERRLQRLERQFVPSAMREDVSLDDRQLARQILFVISRGIHDPEGPAAEEARSMMRALHLSEEDRS